MVALLDITKCLYDAIARMERAAEKGNAIAAAVESVEREWSVKGSGTNLSLPLSLSLPLCQNAFFFVFGFFFFYILNVTEL